MHTLWECTEIQKSLAAVLCLLDAILKTVISPKPHYPLLRIPNQVVATMAKLTLCNLGLTVATWDIARGWGAEEVPTLEEWKREMDIYMAAEKTTYRNRGCPQKFLKIWGCWQTFYGLDLLTDNEEATGVG